MTFVFMALMFVGFLILFVGLAVGLGWLVRISGRHTFEQQTKQFAPWQSFAAAHNLEFVPGRYRFIGSQRPYVAGRYRGHTFKLDTFERGVVSEVDEETVFHYDYTRLRLDINRNLSGKMLRQHLLTGATVKDVVGQLTGGALRGQQVQVQTINNGQTLYCEQRGLQTDPDYLQALFDIIADQADAHLTMLALGGEAALVLRKIASVTSDSALRKTAIHLLHGIGRETRRTLADRTERVLCPHCLARYSAHTVQLTLFDRVTYYGCRVCHHSHDFIEADQVFAILDHQMTQEMVTQNKQMQVNWFARSKPFDFEGVGIAEVTDEEVERFAVAVGNDTDEVRAAGYKQARCIVSAQAHLSENTLRILRRTFGQVKVIDT